MGDEVTTASVATPAAAPAAAPVKESLGEKLEHIGEDVVKVIEFPITFAEKATKILATAEQLDPSLKANIALLLTKAEAIASASTAVAAGDGVNFAADATAVADIGAFFTFVKATIVPELETAYAAIKTDVA